MKTNTHQHEWSLLNSREPTYADNQEWVDTRWVDNERQVSLVSVWVCPCGSFKQTKHYYDMEVSDED